MEKILAVCMVSLHTTEAVDGGVLGTVSKCHQGDIEAKWVS